MKKYIRNNFNKNSYLVFKKFVDIIFAFLSLILISPLFLLIIILIKFSSMGPIFFLHKRIRKGEKIFYCIKFRTMHPEANDILKNILNKNEKLSMKRHKRLKMIQELQLLESF